MNLNLYKYFKRYKVFFVLLMLFNTHIYEFYEFVYLTINVTILRFHDLRYQFCLKSRFLLYAYFYYMLCALLFLI
jgi:hypothetical protein